MTEIKDIKSNTFYSFVSISSRIIPNMLVFWLIARYYGPVAFGKFSYSHTLANTFLLFADFGFDLLLTTEIAKNRSEARTVFQRYFWIKIGLALIALVTMSTFVIIRGGDFDSILIGLVFGFYMLFNTIANFFVASFKGFERLDYDAKVSFVMNSFLLLAAIILFVLNQDILFFAIAYVISRVLGFVYSIKLSHNTMPGLSYKLSFDDINDSLRKAFMYGILILAQSLLFQLDTIMLGIFKSDYEVGVYQAVKNLLLIPFIIPGVVFSALLPALARMFKESPDNWLALNKTFFKIIFWLNLPIAVTLFAYPEQIIRIIYSTKNYASATPILRIFSVILFLRSTSDYLGVMLITSNRQKIHIYVSLTCIVLSLLCGSLIIPTYGSLGAGIVYLIIIVFIAGIYFIVNYDIFFHSILNVKYLVLLFMAILMAFLAERYSFVNALIGIPLFFSVFIFLALSYFFTRIEREKILSIRHLLSRRLS